MVSSMENVFKGKQILITGGTGSIGSEIARQLLRFSPSVLRVLSRDESKQFELQQKLKDYRNVRYLIGDVRDKERLRRAVEDIDIVFHAAALKHVPACEYNPFEAVKTNVLGVQNVIEVALDEEVEKVIAISTDKVANPTNTMGATKLLAERLIGAANYYKGRRRTIFSCVRFGNVMGSRGSVIPLFRSQIEQGGPVTITDPQMTRFMMSIPQAVSLVLRASQFAQGGETFILKMPVLKITDLATVVIEEYAKHFSFRPEDIKIEYIGARPGEKLYEELMTEEEAERALETPEMFIITPSFTEKGYHHENARPTQAVSYTSKNEKPLSKEEIRLLLYKENLLGFPLFMKKS